MFDAVNENLPGIVASFGTDTRKIFANEYIDDRNAWLPSKEVADILYLCDGKQCGDSCPSVECKHTSDISHAKNFVKGDYDSYWEKENRSRQISEDMSQSDPNEDRDGVENAAIIFGDDYDYFADRFAEAIGISRDNIGEV